MRLSPPGGLGGGAGLGRAETRHANPGRGLWPPGCEYGLRRLEKAAVPGDGAPGEARRARVHARPGRDWGTGLTGRTRTGAPHPPAPPGPACGRRARPGTAGGPSWAVASTKGTVPSPGMAAQPPRRGQHVMAERREERAGLGPGKGGEGRPAPLNPAQGETGP